MNKPRWIICSLIVLLFSQNGLGQSTEFTYQGRLLSEGAAANGNHDFEFRLFSDPAGDVQVGSAITLTDVTVNNGVFSVRLDFGNQFPGPNRYLEIRVRQSGQQFFTVLTPRQAITSAPYSIKSLISETANSSSNATNASQLGGVDAAQYVLSSDSRMSDARTPLPNSSNYIRNSSSPQNADFNITGFGTVGGTLTAFRFTATQQFNIGGDRILSNAGTDNLFAGAGAGFFNASGGSNSFVGKNAGGSNTGGSSNSFFGSNAGLSNSPAALGGGNSNSFFGAHAGRNNTTGESNAFFGKHAGLGNVSGNNNSLFGADSNAADGLINATAIGYRSYVGQNNSLILGSIAGVNGGTVHTFIGIGTATPTAKLTVSGNGAHTLQSAARFDLHNTVANAGFIQHVTDAGLWQLATAAGASRLVVDAGGNVGIGTASPSATLQVRANNNNVLIGHAGCNSGFVGLGFGAGLSGCANYSILGNGIDTLIGRPAGGTLYFREANNTQMLISPGGAVTIPGNLTVTGTLSANLPTNNPNYIQNTSTEQTANFNISGNGTVGNKLNSASLSVTNRIGIGTTSPSARLGIVGSGVYNATNAARLDLFNTSANMGYLQHVANDGSWQLATTAGETRVLVDPAGTVVLSNGLVVPTKFKVGVLGVNGSTELCRNASDEIATCSSSSIRYKSNINSFNSGLNLIKRLRPVSFNWKTDNTLDFGLVAEEVAEAEPMLVTKNKRGEVEGVKYDRVGVVLINAVTEQQVQIEAQQKQNRQQKELVAEQQTQIKDLQEQLHQQRMLIESLRKTVCQSNPNAAICKEESKNE